VFGNFVWKVMIFNICKIRDVPIPKFQPITIPIPENWFEPIPIPRISTDIYRYRYFSHCNIKDFNLYRYRYLKIDLNRYRYLPIPIPKISTDIYRYRYFGTSLCKIYFPSLKDVTKFFKNLTTFYDITWIH